MSMATALPPPPAPASAPYMEEMMQKAVVFTAVLMAILGGTLSVVGLERLIRGRFTLFSMARFLLRFTFLLFLPLLSYMLSHAEDEKKEPELLFVLLWMLLLELVHKKVDAMVPSAEASFSRAASRFRLMGHSDEVTRLVWIGYLIYTNVDKLRSYRTMMIIMFAILWSLAVAKLGQRVLNEWMAQDSLSAAGSANLIAGYMQHLLEEEEKKEKKGNNGVRVSSGSGADASSTDPVDKCEYVVMGEEKLVLKKKARRQQSTDSSSSKVIITTPHCGYGVGRFPQDQDELKHVHLLVDLDKAKSLVTVKKISEKLEGGFLSRKKRPHFIDHMYLLCFSFSLFKLLRRRFEHYPMVEVGSMMARHLMVRGLLDHEPSNPAADNAARAFRVIQMELDFLENYYQAGVPVVMSAPWLFIVNYLSSLLFVLIYLLSAILIAVTARNETTSSVVTYSIVTLLLLMTLLAIEITDFLTAFVLSNWFLVHLVCLYVAPGNCLWNWLVKPIICCFIAWRLLVFYSLRLFLRLTGRPVDEKKIKIKQVSIAQVCEPIHELVSWASQVTMATEAKVAIVEALKGIEPDTGKVSLPEISGLDSRGKTATEIILACHLTTELLEAKHGKRKMMKKKKQQKPEDCHRTVATTLSRYCMYLVARAPELLPDDERWVFDRYEDVKSCLKEASRRHRCCCSTWCCCCLWRGGCLKAVMEMSKDQLKEPTASAGVELFQELQKKDYAADRKHLAEPQKEDYAAAWKGLADFWTKLLVYLAPSNDVEGHAKALASSGADLITCLWAFCTHAGITRKPAELHANEPRDSDQV